MYCVQLLQKELWTIQLNHGLVTLNVPTMTFHNGQNRMKFISIMVFLPQFFLRGGSKWEFVPNNREYTTHIIWNFSWNNLNVYAYWMWGNRTLYKLWLWQNIWAIRQTHRISQPRCRFFTFFSICWEKKGLTVLSWKMKRKLGCCWHIIILQHWELLYLCRIAEIWENPGNLLLMLKIRQICSLRILLWFSRNW